MIIIKIIIIFEVISGIWNIMKSYITNKIIKKSKNNSKIKDYKINIIIPCLREQDIVIDTLEYFVSIMDKFKAVKLIIVTTEKEEYERKRDILQIKDIIKDIKSKKSISYIANKYNTLLSINMTKAIYSFTEKEIKSEILKSKTTADIVDEYLKKKKYKNILHIHYPNKDGIMSDQLNYVVKRLAVLDDTKEYISVYNADSRPSIKTLEELSKNIGGNNFPEVLQQYSYAFLNIENLSGIMKGFALYQSNFEIKYGLMNSIIFPKFLYTYVVGHGMFVRFDIIKQLGGFENKFWCEDIYMSAVLRNKNINIVPIFALEKMETPQYLNIQIQQNAVWFKTASQWKKMFQYIKRQYSGITYSCINWFIQRIIMNITWLILPIIFLYSILYSVIVSNYNFLIYSLMAYLFMEVSKYVTTLYTIDKIEKIKTKNKVYLVVMGIFASFISNFGPIYSLIKRNMKKYKTVR